MIGVALLLLAACGSGNESDTEQTEPEATKHTVDYTAWEAALEDEVGHEVADFDTVVDVYLDPDGTEDGGVCVQDDLGYFVAVGIDEGQLPITMISFEYACPDRLPEVRNIVQGLQ
jgi:hypothetical protein